MDFVVLVILLLLVRVSPPIDGKPWELDEWWSWLVVPKPPLSLFLRMHHDRLTAEST